MNRYAKIGTMALLFCLFSFSAFAAKNVALVGPSAPFCVNKGLRINGIAVDTYATIMKMTGTPINIKKIKFVEWEVAYKVAKAMPNSVLLGVERTPELEEQYKWVGPIDFPREILVGKEGVKYDIAPLSKASKYSIGAVRGSTAVDYFISKGVSEDAFTLSTSYVQPIRNFQKGKLDLLAFTDMEIAFLMTRMRIEPKKYAVVHQSRGIPLYFAFGKNTDDEYIKMLNNALATYKTPSSQWTSAYDTNVRKYLPKGVVD